MKIIATAVILLYSCAGYCQQLDTARINKDERTMHLAGAQLTKAMNSHTGGAFCTLIGGSIMAFGSASNNKTVIVTGSVLTVIGFSLTMNAWTHIGQAGTMLRTGTLDIPIKKKKKTHVKEL